VCYFRAIRWYRSCFFILIEYHILICGALLYKGASCSCRDNQKGVIMGLFSKRMGVDLGTVNVLIYENGQIVLQEPSLVALEIGEDGDERIIELGQPAREMMGRVDEEAIQVVRPLQNGVIADYEITEKMLEYFFDKVAGRLNFFKPTVMISVPYGVTSVEKRAVHEAALAAGAREVFLIWEPLAAAIGAGLPVNTPAGDMVVNIGGGITEAAVITMSNIIRAESGRVGGIRLDEAIQSYIRNKYNLAIGLPTAESVKIQVGAAVPQPQEMTMEVQGRNIANGLPQSIPFTTSEVVEALEDTLKQIAKVAKSVLSNTPPELASDIIDRGIVMTGGGALLRGLDRYLTKETGVPVYRADNPMLAVATGAGKALDNQALMNRIKQFN
jgi:rod shape-determining protein MreB